MPYVSTRKAKARKCEGGSETQANKQQNMDFNTTTTHLGSSIEFNN